MKQTRRRRALAWCIALGGALPLAPFAATFASPPEEAYEKALQGVLDDAANPEKSFDFVEAAIAAGDLRGAAAALERILLIDPRLANIRLELGVLYLRMNNAALAQYHLTEALRAPNVPSTVRVRAERLLAQASGAARRNTFRLEASVGYRYDDNANAGPSAASVFVTDPFTLQPVLVPLGEGAETADSAFELAVRASHSYAFAGGSSWDTDVTAYAVRYSDLDGLDQHSLGVETGPTWVFAGTPDAPISLRPSALAGKAWLDGDDYYDYTGGGLTLNGFWSPATLTQLRVTYENRDFSDSPTRVLSDRSGDYVTGDLRQIWQLGRWQVSLGLTGTQVDADADYQSYDSFGGTAGVRYFGQFAGSGRPWSAYLSAEYASSDYDAADPFVNATIVREDDRLYVTAGVEIAVSRSWSVSLDLSHVDNSSNLPNYEYDSFAAGLRATYRF